MGYLLPGRDGLGVPPDGQSSLETAVAAAAVAVPPPAPRRRRAAAANPPLPVPRPPRKEFLQFNMDIEVQ